MKLTKATIYNSPFLGVYCFCNEDYCIVPNTILKKEEKLLSKYLDTKIIKTQINQSSLIGVFLVGNKDKIVVQKDSIEPIELEILEKEGLKVKLVDDYNALGNLIALNSNFGIASPLLKKETIKEISKFLNIEIEQKVIGSFDLAGSSLYVNDKLFFVNPNIDDDEYQYITKKFKVEGRAITLNYGDVFVGNDIIANSKTVIVGESTSSIELMKVDELVVEFDE